MSLLKKAVAVAAAAGLMLSLAACDEGKKVLESTDEEKSVVMTVNGYDVPLEIYRYVALNYKKDYESGKSADIWLGDEGRELLKELNDDVRETIVRLYTTPVVAGEYGINVDDAYITDAVDSRMEAVYEEYEFDYKSYAAQLQEYNMNDGVYRFITRNDVLSEEILYKMMQNGEIPGTDEEIMAVLESPEMIRVKQLLISSENHSESEGLELAEKYLAELKAGADFDELVQKHGEDLFMFNNPDGYYITKGTYFTEFEDASYALEVGEMSGIVKSSAGYSIIKRYDKDMNYVKKNFDTLSDSYVSGMYNVIVEKKSADVKAEECESLSEYSIFTLEGTKREIK